MPFDQNVSLPMFIPNRISKKQLYSLFGSLSDHTTKDAGAQASGQVRLQKDEPRIIAGRNIKAITNCAAFLVRMMVTSGRVEMTT